MAQENKYTRALTVRQIEDFFKNNLPEGWKLHNVQAIGANKKVNYWDENQEYSSFMLYDDRVVPKHEPIEKTWKDFLRSTFGDDYLDE